MKPAARHAPSMAGLSDAATGRLVGAGLVAAALAMFALVEAIGLTGTARAVAFLLLSLLLVLVASAGLVVWILRRQRQPLTERPDPWEMDEDWE